MFHVMSLMEESFEQSSVINRLMKSSLEEEDGKHYSLQSKSLQRLHTAKLGYKNRFCSIYTTILGNSAESRTTLIVTFSFKKFGMTITGVRLYHCYEHHPMKREWLCCFVSLPTFGVQILSKSQLEI